MAHAVMHQDTAFNLSKGVGVMPAALGPTHLEEGRRQALENELPREFPSVLIALVAPTSRHEGHAFDFKSDAIAQALAAVGIVRGFKAQANKAAADDGQPAPDSR